MAVFLRDSHNYLKGFVEAKKVTKDEIIDKMVELKKQEEEAIVLRAWYFGVDLDKYRAASEKLESINREQDKYERMYHDS